MTQLLQLALLTALVALVASLAKAPRSRVARPRSAEEALREVTSSDGYVLVTVDEDKCGYCGAAKIMLDARGVEYREVNISDVPEHELGELVDALGIEHVPVLLYVENGSVVFKRHFEGVRERDVAWVRELEV